MQLAKAAWEFRYVVENNAPQRHSTSTARLFYFLTFKYCWTTQGLTKLLSDQAPGALREQKFENYFGRKIAVDASMHIYSFLVSYKYKYCIIEIDIWLS